LPTAESLLRLTVTGLGLFSGFGAAPFDEAKLQKTGRTPQALGNEFLTMWSRLKA
jgi:hypothetical protein